MSGTIRDLISPWAGAAKVAAFLGGVLLLGWTVRSELYAMELVETIQDEKIDKLSENVKELMLLKELIMLQTTAQAAQNEKIDQIWRRGLRVLGKAYVLDSGDSPYLELNTWGANGPTRLVDFKKIQVTNVYAEGGRVTEAIRVGPTFNNSTPDWSINLSRAAGQLLHAGPNTWIEVLLVPVFDED